MEPDFAATFFKNNGDIHAFIKMMGMANIMPISRKTIKHIPHLRKAIQKLP